MRKLRPGDPLTDKQATFLAWLDAFILAHQYPPTVCEIMDGMGYASPTAVRCHFAALVAKGFLKKRSGIARALRIFRRRDRDRLLINGTWYRFIPAALLEENACRSVAPTSC